MAPSSSSKSVRRPSNQQTKGVEGGGGDGTTTSGGGGVGGKRKPFEPPEEKPAKQPKMVVPRSNGFAKMQPIFTEFVQMTPELRREIQETQEMLKHNFSEIREEYIRLTNEEMFGDQKIYMHSMKRTNFFLENLKKRVKTVQTCRELTKKVSKTSGCNIISLRPDKTPNGTHKTRIESVNVWIPFAPNKMNFWIPIEQNMIAKDQLRLTHMPDFEDEKINEKELYSELSTIFYDGIHGCSGNWSYINDWLLYKLFLKCLRQFKGSNPDVFYYSVYRLWPNKLSQRQLSQQFPNWCSLYSGDDSWRGMEKWKKENEYIYAENMQNITCYACLEYACPLHGFKSQLAPEYPDGDFVIATLPLPVPTNQKTPECSKSCFKSIDKSLIDEVFELKEEEIERGGVEIYLDKKHISQMIPEDGGTILSCFQFNHYLDFCEFAKRAVDPEADDELNTCLGAYKLILKWCQDLTPRRLDVGIPKPLLSKQERVKAYRSTQLSRHNAKKKKRHEEIRKYVEKHGGNVRELIAEDDEKQAQSDDKVMITAVTPFVPCRHDGPCDVENELCSCRENGMSHHLFMRCLFHAKHDPSIKFDVKTININKKNQEFIETGLRRTPGISCVEEESGETQTFETEDEILDFLEFLKPSRGDDEEAENATCDLFRQFARFVKDVEHRDTSLNTELLRLDKYLSEHGTRFLLSDDISHIDCLVLTRLHSIRIAAKALKNYDIPSDLTHLLEYLKSGYDTEMFRLSCPSDQEIILHWTDLKDTPTLSAKERAKMVRDEPVYTFSI
uniref:[Histone H3]-lysine(27) N-trimethyltransferase n=1 Tax=Caenorhabditis tropicalis TaxID=1561998 RepID=A0A1I7U7N6_9PELO